MKFRNGALPGGLADALTDGGGAMMVFGATAGTMVAVGGAGASYALSGCSSNIIPAAYPTGDATGTGQIAITFFAGDCGTNPLTTVTGTIRAAAAP